MSGSIVVCPLSKLAETLGESQAGSIVTLLSPGFAPARPLFGPVRHLTIDVSDISVAHEGHVLPADIHIERLLAFVTAWDRRSPLLIHCYAGVSRSTAAAYAAFCALSPELSEDDVAIRLRTASPTATPNPRLVALADMSLGRGGRMGAAIERIGRGADCFEGNVFRLELPSRLS